MEKELKNKVVEMFREYQARKKKIDAAKEEFWEWRAMFSQFTDLAPWKVGDVVPVNSWAHHGKKMRIVSVSCEPETDKYNGVHLVFAASGRVLKKNGEFSKYDSKLFHSIVVDRGTRPKDE